mmetsp:Transcript_68488/g.163878  ORF Transcript_68488/g.163878 Transcript_68488/m.163878 type:complete len:240 (-) Transcript_68488:41-760(-)
MPPRLSHRLVVHLSLPPLALRRGFRTDLLREARKARATRLLLERLEEAEHVHERVVVVARQPLQILQVLRRDFAPRRCQLLHGLSEDLVEDAEVGRSGLGASLHRVDPPHLADALHSIRHQDAPRMGLRQLVEHVLPLRIQHHLLQPLRGRPRLCKDRVCSRGVKIARDEGLEVPPHLLVQRLFVVAEERVPLAQQVYHLRVPMVVVAQQLQHLCRIMPPLQAHLDVVEHFRLHDRVDL